VKYSFQNSRYVLGATVIEKTMILQNDKQVPVTFCTHMFAINRKTKLPNAAAIVKARDPVTVYLKLQGTFTFAAALEKLSKPSSHLAVVFMHDAEAMMCAPLKDVRFNSGFAPTFTKDFFKQKTDAFLLREPIEIRVQSPTSVKIEKQAGLDKERDTIIPAKKHYLRERKKRFTLHSPISSKDESDKENASPPPKKGIKKGGLLLLQPTAKKEVHLINQGKNKLKFGGNAGKRQVVVTSSEQHSTNDDNSTLKEIKDMLLAQNNSLNAKMSQMEEKIAQLEQAKNA